MPRAKFQSGFSLVETMVVLTIISILGYLTVTSTSLLRTSNLSATGNQMVDVFSLARQNSLAHNAFTAVVIRRQGAGACAAYTLLELPRQQDGGFGSWTALTTWRYLPAGVVFETNQVSVDTFMAALNQPALPVSLPTSYLFKGGQVDLTDATMNAVQCYSPEGTLVGGKPIRLRLIAGMAATDGTITYTGALASGNQVSYYDIYFVADTGSTIIGRP